MVKMQKRIFLIMLSGVCLSFLLFGMIAMITRNADQEAANRMGKEFAQGTAEEIWQNSEQQWQEMLQQLAVARAQQLNSKVRNLRNDVEMLGSAMTRIASNLNDYHSQTLSDPSLKTIWSGEAYVTYGTEEIAANPAIQHEISLAANIKGEMKDIADQYTGHRMLVYAASQKGYFITVDIMPDGGQSNEPDGTHIFEPRTRAWYINAKNAGTTVFSDVYMDYTTGQSSITCATPYYNKEGFAGVVGMGAYLDVVYDVLLASDMGNASCFILTDKGEMVFSSQKAEDFGLPANEEMLKDSQGPLAEVTELMRAGKSGVRVVELNGSSYYLSFAPVQDVGWSLGILTPQQSGISQADKAREMFLNLLQDFRQGVDANHQQMNIFLSAALLLVLLFFFLGSHQLAKRFARPIQLLTEGVQDISTGNLEKRIQLSTGDELETLADSFNDMTSKLKDHIEGLAKITAEKERIATELSVAAKIQLNMLPRDFSLGAGRMDIFASMTPAKAVGGDFYDFYLVDENHAAVLIADVAGKGIPAALFMAAAKNCLKSSLLSQDNPDNLAKAMIAANARLCEDNREMLFITAFLGVLDLRSGLLRFVNAGHNPVFIRQKEQDKAFRKLPMKRNFVLAGWEDYQYVQEEVLLSEGDVLFLYTDGVNEAMNEADEMYGLERLENFLNSEQAAQSKNMEELVKMVQAEVADFVGNAEPADDITMLAVAYGGRKM